MHLPDTNLLIYNDDDPPDTPDKGESDADEDLGDEESDSKEGFQEFLDKIRFYNRQGPHYIYSDRNEESDRKLKDHRRLIKKSGKYNVSRHVESQIWDKYLRDLSSTLVHSRWRWTVITTSSSFILSWLMFAVIWMLISNANGDLETDDDSSKCLLGIQGFAGYFLFSMETQVSIGYGTRSANDLCPEVIFIMCMQIIFGVAICGMTINIVYIKMTKSQHRYSKLFSRRAVICRRDGELCMIFRIRDEDSRHAIGTTVTAYVLRKDKETGEPYLETIPLEPHGFLIWPLEIVHKITSTSPLWDVSSYNLLSDKFEVIVTLQGTSPTTALCSRTRTSYISSEILWGHKFKNCIRYVKKENAYVVHERNFNATEEYSTHLCSAKRFAEVYSSLSPTPAPTPTPKNLGFKLNILYSRNQRRGTVMSIETADGSYKLNEQYDNVKDGKEKMIRNRVERIRDSLQSPYVESPVSPTSSPRINNTSQSVFFPSKNENIPHSTHEVIRQNSNDPYDKQWDYQNHAGSHLPDFWLKEAASLPLINNYNQENGLRTRKFGSDLQQLRGNRVHGTVRNVNASRETLNQPKIFEGEDFIFENGLSTEESNISLVSGEYTRSEVEIEHDPELDFMLRSMESYLEQQSEGRSISNSPFPKS